MVLERGENFTTQDLVKEADVALQTFYRHFGSKDQLLIAVIGEMIVAHCDALAARAATLDSYGGGRFMTSQHWRLQQLHPEALAEANRPFADLVQSEIEAARAAGLLTPRAPEREAWIINQLGMAVFHYYSFADDDAADTVADDVWHFCIAALGRASQRRRGRTEPAQALIAPHARVATNRATLLPKLGFTVAPVNGSTASCARSSSTRMRRVPCSLPLMSAPAPAPTRS